MLIEITPESRFQMDNVAIPFKLIAITNPMSLRTQFVRDNRLILSGESVRIISKIRNKVKYQILALDEYRKRIYVEQNKVYYTSSSNIKMNDYNNRQVRDFINSKASYYF